MQVCLPEYQARYLELTGRLRNVLGRRDLNGLITNYEVTLGFRCCFSQTAVLRDRRTKVLAFGTFDLLHKGHESFLRQAADLGDYVIVVVARDESARRAKGRRTVQTAIERLSSVLAVPQVDEAHLADKDPESYRLLAALVYDVLAVGYDQKPSDEAVVRLLRRIGKPHVRLVRLTAFAPHAYKSSRIRDTLGA